MRIALDVMGGDHGPDVTIDGAYLFLKEQNQADTVVLVGDRSKIEKKLEHIPENYHQNFEIVHAPENIRMDESPTEAVKRKKNSSMVVGLNLHKEEKVQAFVSAGNTGAQLAASLLNLGRIKGVKRPGIGAFLPSEKGWVFMIDAGANVDSKPIHLLQFAIMANVFVADVFESKDIKTGLLSIGEEEKKGNELTTETHQMLKKYLPNFVGNIEGGDILKGKTEIIVCDGFVGNILLKMAESIMGVLLKSIKKNLGSNLFTNLGALLVKPAFTELKRGYDYEEHGGVPLLGVNGISIICHGKSTSKAIKNALLVAKNMDNKKVNNHIANRLNEGVMDD